MHRRLNFYIALAGGLIGCTACTPDAELSQREQIYQQTVELDTLYLTNDGAEVIAPGNPIGAVIDPQSGELAFEAYQCSNPDCPGERKTDRPFLFTRVNPSLAISDGQVVYIDIVTPEQKTAVDAYSASSPTCPACLKERNLNAETSQQRRQYSMWVQKYVLPESAEKLQQLDEDLQQLVQERHSR